MIVVVIIGKEMQIRFLLVLNQIMSRITWYRDSLFLYVKQFLVQPISYKNNLYKSLFILKLTCLIAMGLFLYLLSWVTNSCSIYPLAESRVPEILYTVSRHFSKAIIGESSAFLEERCAHFHCYLELVLCSHTFFTQALIN